MSTNKALISHAAPFDADSLGPMSHGGSESPRPTGTGILQLGVTPAERQEVLQDDFESLSSYSPSVSAPSTTSTAPSSALLGELVFDKFARTCPTSESMSKPNRTLPMFSSTTTRSAEVHSAMVENFFDSSPDSTPLFELDGFEKPTDPKNWSSLFDDDILVTLDEVTSAEVPDTTSAQSEDALSSWATDVISATTPNQPVLDQASTSEKARAPVAVGNPITPPVRTTPVPSRKRGSVTKPERYDHLGVITYNRKQRATPLTPVVPESDDPVALKRARNTEAARRSRARKLERMNQLEGRVEELLRRNSRLEEELANLKALLAEKSQ